jgi:hypothetical protein
MSFVSPRACSMSRQSHPPGLVHPKISCQGVHNYEAPHYAIFSVGSNNFLDILHSNLSNTLCLCSSNRVRYQVSHPYETEATRECVALPKTRRELLYFELGIFRTNVTAEWAELPLRRADKNTAEFRGGRLYSLYVEATSELARPHRLTS